MWQCMWAVVDARARAEHTRLTLQNSFRHSWKKWFGSGNRTFLNLPEPSYMPPSAGHHFFYWPFFHFLSFNGRHFDICCVAACFPHSLKQFDQSKNWRRPMLQAANPGITGRHSALNIKPKSESIARLPENKSVQVIKVSCPQTNPPLPVNSYYTSYLLIDWHTNKDWHIQS